MKYLSGVLLMLLSGSIQAFDGTPKEQVSAFFSVLKNGNTSKAIDELYSSNPIMNQKAQQLTMLKQQLASVEPLFGKFINNENIHYEKLSPSLVRIVELAKYNDHPIVWEFYFYKPKKKWIISQGIFNDQFTMVSNKK